MIKNGAEILLEGLLANNQNTIFGYPGGSVIPLYDTLLKYPQINHILVRHEQGAGFAANGYGRITKTPGVCLATSGPGATNLITAVADAMIDSVPMIVLTGQVFSHLLGSDAFQEGDTMGMFLPSVKHSYSITNVEELPKAISEAFYLSTTGRPGPIHIDITKNVFLEKIEFSSFPQPNIPGYKPTMTANIHQINKVVESLKTAEKPVVIIGQGALISKAEKEVLEFLELTGVPCVQTLLGLSTIPAKHPQNLGMLGMHGQVYANNAVHNADLIISFGSRFDDRITGNLKDFTRQAKFIHFDIDPAEIGKNIVDTFIPVVGDLNKSLSILNPLLEKEKFAFAAWKKQIDKWKIEYSIDKVHKCNSEKCKNSMRAWDVISILEEETNGNAVIVSDVGQHQMWIAQGYDSNIPNSFLFSGGFGSMGFSLPAAMGAKVGCKEREVWSISGDGGFQMNLQEMMTLIQEGLPVKIAILNNNYLGMVRQWQELFESGYSFVDMQNPDFVKLGEAYGIPSFKATNKENAREYIKKCRELKGPTLIEFHITKEENVFPMVPQGKSLGDTRIS
jgi:acetolactate synthase-1/2/3 large subunit